MANKITNFLQQTKAELKKVTWPTKDQTVKLTIVVILISLVVSLYLGSLDYIFNKLLKYVVEIIG